MLGLVIVLILENRLYSRTHVVLVNGLGEG